MITAEQAKNNVLKYRKEQAKNNVLKYRKEQAERDYVQEELDSLLSRIEYKSSIGATYCDMYVSKPIKPNGLIVLEKLKGLGYTVTQEKISRKDLEYNDYGLPRFVEVHYIYVKISWDV